jgi:DNA-binding MarR family transcriptional regulator
MDVDLATKFAAIAQAAVNQMDRRTTDLLKMDGQATAALIVIGSAPGQPIERLRQALEMSHSGCVRLVERLMLAGYAERHVGRNKREAAIHLTAVGEQMRSDLLAARREGAWAVFSNLDNAERNTIRVHLARILDRMAPDGNGAEGVCRLCDVAVCKDCPAHKPGQTEWRYRLI